jgi:hypothetical protein
MLPLREQLTWAEIGYAFGAFLGCLTLHFQAGKVIPGTPIPCLPDDRNHTRLPNEGVTSDKLKSLD